MSKETSKMARVAWLSLLLSLAAVQVLSAQQQTVPAKEATPAAANASPAPDARAAVQPASQYRIGPRDVLTIRVTAPDIVPQFSADAMEVDECGMIPLLSVQNEAQSQVKAAGFTTSELQEQLRKFYTKYKRNPQVVVKVKEYNSQPVAINGAVMRPGQFQMRRPVRLLELLNFYAGGPTERNGGRIQIARIPMLGDCASAQEVAAVLNAQGEDVYAPRFFIFNLSDTLKGEERSNPYLQPGDVITLPEAKEAYVIGNVLRPGPILLKDDNLTVTRALAMAGGKMPDTKDDKVRIIRPNPGGGESQEIPVDLSAIKNHKAEDVLIRANDIIEVPVSGGKRLLRSLVGTVVPTVGNLPVQVIR
jgi:polysaccharide biosynthesis/export protein